jgi:hypothetical protein
VPRLFLVPLLALAAACAAPLLPDVQTPVPRPGVLAAPGPLPASTLPNERDSVKFLVIGDSGTGDRRQYEVAAMIAKTRERFPFEFGIMLGDNLYGREGPGDYVKKFETPYKPLLDLGVRFYASLGNHDDPTQRFYEPFNMDGKRFYTFRKKDVEFFVLDSTYMSPQQIEWLEGELEGSDAKWKISYFHHPIYSSGWRHGSERDLQRLIEPLFLEHGERLKPQKGIVYITQGGAAKLRRGNIRDRSPLTAKGFDTDRSFTLIEIVDDQMYFETISRLGTIVDSGWLPRREVAGASEP